MSGFSLEKTQWGIHDMFVLHDVQRGRRVCVAQRGANLVSLEQTIDGVTHALIDGYRDADELERSPSSRSAIMAPFANRIAEARYTFDGKTYDMQPGVEAQRGIRHGFVRTLDFDVASQHADTHGARMTFSTSVIRPGTFPGYPFAIDLAVTYVLDASGLSLMVSMRNVGNESAPCFFGWHPYFRFDGTELDTWELQVPAAKLVRTSPELIPLAGEEAFLPIEQAPKELDFRHSRPIGSVKIDCAFADLAHDADGRVRTRLRDPASGLRISMWQERGVVLVFTADTVSRDVRRAVAMEPMESMSNAFNRADCADAIRLEPGVERVFRCGVEIDRA
ncbi:aldose 1-epimerase [Dyella nitratireducens]|uniref:Aldose epimerase n=1 Tax=Dyella nitratireducens TaxID=1849580 RepID=A0ABQ1GT87_9GAMM|nr:aldose epimerase [Dyella nitratireducens]GGA49466.1 aldose epimerase [Dyella nitratireducens]GLQ42175.1 aldose epimerase [Dyella nitratireducens]